MFMFRRKAAEASDSRRGSYHVCELAHHAILRHTDPEWIRSGWPKEVAPQELGKALNLVSSRLDLVPNFILVLSTKAKDGDKAAQRLLDDPRGVMCLLRQFADHGGDIEQLGRNTGVKLKETCFVFLDSWAFVLQSENNWAIADRVKDFSRELASPSLSS